MTEEKREGGKSLHIAIIMDGNGRWAKKRNLPRIAGHKAGERAITNTVRVASEIGLNALTLFAFSTENWNRPKEEVSFLMSFNRNLLSKRVDEFHERNIRIRHLGLRDRIPASTLNEMDRAMSMTRNNSGMTLCIAFNYGGRAEIAKAAARCSQDVRDGLLEPGDIDENAFAARLSYPDIPDPDILIRTAGEYRISNFLLWQLAYAELFFIPVLWPDFKESDLRNIVSDYEKRERRFGKII